MNNNQYITNIAMFMIFLIVLLPIQSSVAMGATVDSIQAYGTKKILGYRAQDDITVINVTATVTEDSTLGTGQVKILEDPTKAFNCSLTNNVTQTFTCLLTYAKNNLIGTSVLSFTVQIFSDAGTAISPSTKGSLTVDSLPPKVVDLYYSGRNGSAVEASYNVTDEACSASTCSGLCTGIGSVEFTVAGTSVGKNSSFGSGCAKGGKMNLTGLIVGGSVQTKRICIKATDKLDQSSTSCKDVTLDAKSPQITGIGLFDGNYNPVKYTNGLPLGNVRLIVNISEDSNFSDPRSGKPNFINVNASELSENTAHKAVFGTRPAKCTQRATGQYECVVDGLFLIMTSAKTISVRVEAKDEHGNILNQTKSLSLTYDRTAPVATKIYSQFVDDLGNYWIGKENNTITMTITEAGSGMENRNAFLDFSGFGSQDLTTWGTTSSISLLAPNECKSGWTCNWYRIQTDKASGTTLYLTPKLGSRDDANNAFGSPLPTGTIKVDVDAPEVDDPLRNVSNITAVGEGHDPMLNITGGDKMVITLFVKDHSGLKGNKAYANLSEVIVGGSETAEGNCTENQIISTESQRIFKCTWSASPVRPGYLGPTANNAPSIYFTFEDNANHTGYYEWEDIEILASENVTTPSWIITVSDIFSPSLGLDRLTWKLSQPKMFYQLSFTGDTARNPSPLSVKLDGQSCSNLAYLNVDVATSKVSVNLMGYPGYEARPKPPFQDMVEIGFNPDSVPPEKKTMEDNTTQLLEKLYINCTITITSIIQTTYNYTAARAITQAEKYNVTFPVPVYNNPLGQNIGNIKEELEAMKEANEAWEFLTILRQIFSVLQEICNMIGMLVKIDAAIAVVKDIFATNCGTKVPGVAATSCTISQAMGKTLDADSQFIPEFVGEVYKFCGLFISCRPSKPGGKSCAETSTWCTVQKKWYDITTFVSSKLNLYIDRYLRAGKTGFFDTGSFDPKLSMISSAYSLCIPGLINNLEKFRQIHCKKILCYKIDVSLGRPVWRCDQEYAYLICTHVVGQVFAAFPIFQFISNVGEMIEGIFRNPYGLIGMVVDKACNVICSGSSTVGCSICRGITFVPAIVNIVIDLVESTGPRFDMATFDMCDEALKDDPDYDNLEMPAPKAGTAAAGN